MKITNVVEISDNDEFVTIVTKTGTVVHLPNGQHSLTIHDMGECPADNYTFNVMVDAYQN